MVAAAEIRDPWKTAVGFFWTVPAVFPDPGNTGGGGSEIPAEVTDGMLDDTAFDWEAIEMQEFDKNEPNEKLRWMKRLDEWKNEMNEKMRRMRWNKWWLKQHLPHGGRQIVSVKNWQTELVMWGCVF